MPLTSQGVPPHCGSAAGTDPQPTIVQEHKTYKRLALYSYGVSFRRLCSAARVPLRAVLDMSCGGHVRSSDSPVCSSILCPACRVGVTISTIVSFTCVLGHSRTVSPWRVYCRSRPQLHLFWSKRPADQCRQPRTVAAVHTRGWSTITGLPPCAFAFNETVQKGSPLKLNTWP
jgi:hypothetical protein